MILVLGEGLLSFNSKIKTYLGLTMVFYHHKKNAIYTIKVQLIIFYYLLIGEVLLSLYGKMKVLWRLMSS